MTSTMLVVCPNCKHEFTPEEAFRHAIEEQITQKNAQKYKEEIEQARKEASAQASEKAKADAKLSLKLLEEEAGEAKKRNQSLEEQILELTKEIRETRREAADQKLEMEKKRAVDEDRIRQEAAKKADEQHHLKEMEYEKKIQDVQKKNEELRHTIEQGSQQTQGEVLELELETILKEKFPTDEIEEVAKGVRGADVTQTVYDKYGRNCGQILWEAKNGKWTDNWIQKLKEDMRSSKAQVAILVVANPPADLKTFTYRDGVWITNRASVEGLAWAIRFNLGQINSLKLASKGKNEKMETLFGYMTGNEFAQRVEAIVEGFNGLKDEMIKEKRYFQTKWARQEKEIDKVLENTQGLYGDLQAVTGKGLPAIKGMDLPGLEEGES